MLFICCELMGCSIPRIDSDINLDQYTIRQCHEALKCNYWWYFHVLRLCFQKGKAVFFNDKICHVGLHTLTILYLNNSCREGLKSRLLVAGNDPIL